MTRAMISAEILKLRRNRGLMAMALLLSAGVVGLTLLITGLQYASDPAHHGPAGGTVGFTRVVRTLGEYFGLLVAVLIGGEAGAADISAGVFRDLVATGRSRLTLFGVRVPGAVAVTLPIIAAAYAIGLIGTFALAGGTATPSVGLVLRSAAWIALTTAVVTALGVAIGSITGSRALTLTGLIGWEMVASNLLLNTSALGSVRNVVLNGALGQFTPINVDRSLHMSSIVAVGVTIAWLTVSLGLGAWRTRIRDA